MTERPHHQSIEPADLGPPVRRLPLAGLVRVVLAIAMMIGTVGLIGSPASAQEEGDGDGGADVGSDAGPVVEVAPATVTAVNAASGDVEVVIVDDGYDVSPSDVNLIVGGEMVEDFSVTTAAERGRVIEVVYVLDTANRAVAGGGLSAMATAIIRSVDALPANVRVGLVSAGEQATLKTRLTTDRSRLEADLRALVAGRTSSLHDGVGLAAEAFSEMSTAGAVRSVVVLSSGPDTASELSLQTVESGLVQRGAQLIWVARGAGDAGLAKLVADTGGATMALPDLEQVNSVISSATETAADRLLVSFAPVAETGNRVDVALNVDGQALQFSYPAGIDTNSGLQLAARQVTEAKDLGLFGQPAALYASVVLAFVAISTALWALGSMFASGDTSLDKVLARYSERDETLDDDEVQEMLVQTALVRRAIDMTETFAESRGFLTRIEELLERANLPVRAGEALFFLAALVLVATGLLFAVTGSLLVGLVVGLICAIGGLAAVQFIAGRRLKAFEAQLPDALQLLAGTMRAGYSLPQGLDAVSNEIADPMGYELRRAITETQLGRELEDALAGIAERLDSEDFAWAVMAIGIQREVGGNLAEVLLTVSETMIQRERLHREVAALTAEGRVSAGILSLLPPGLGLAMYVMNPDYLGILFERRIGWALLGAAVVAALVGLAWMKKVVTIDV